MKIDFVIAQRKERYVIGEELIGIGQSYHYTFIKALPKLYNLGRGTLIDSEREGHGYFVSALNIIAGETYDE